ERLATNSTKPSKRPSTDLTSAFWASSSSSWCSAPARLRRARVFVCAHGEQVVLEAQLLHVRFADRQKRHAVDPRVARGFSEQPHVSLQSGSPFVIARQ